MATKATAITQKIMSLGEIKQFQEFEAELASADGVSVEAIFGGGIIRRVIRWAVSIVAAQARRSDPEFDEEGFKAEVDHAVNAIGDGELWKWLVDGGFAKILEWVMLILSLFMAKKKAK